MSLAWFSFRALTKKDKSLLMDQMLVSIVVSWYYRTDRCVGKQVEYVKLITYLQLVEPLALREFCRWLEAT